MNLSSAQAGYWPLPGLLRPPFSNRRLPFIAQGDAYTGVETPTGGSNADVKYTVQKALTVQQ